LIQINGLTITSTLNLPTIGTITSSVPGLQAELILLTSPVQQDANRVAVLCNTGSFPGTPCVYALKFSLNKLPNTGVTNQQVTVRLNQGVSVMASLIATINLNCAPIFQTVTAAVGLTPGLANPITVRLGTEITPLPFPPAGKAFPSASTFQVAAAAGGGLLSQYVVNYNIPNGIGDSGNPNTMGAGGSYPRKVFVNCIVNGGTTPFLAGTTVIGSVVVCQFLSLFFQQITVLTSSKR
jgi:hypothetical protein